MNLVKSGQVIRHEALVYVQRVHNICQESFPSKCPTRYWSITGLVCLELSSFAIFSSSLTVKNNDKPEE